MAKANAVVSVEKGEGGITVRVVGFDGLTAVPGNFSAEINRKIWVNGITQKLVDAAALSRDPVTGKPASPAEKFAAIEATLAMLKAGEWTSEREGGATSILFEALCNMMGDEQTPESIRATLDGMTDAEKRALPLDPEVAPFYKAVKDARDAKRGAGVDTKSVLARFKS